mmetsp:Transcript_53636/g.61558  ORF Transcript_53636/g.61558 Transcript_53636/m.61558 type:complete len:137 (+) Transcript_53636:92-502(+)
MLLQRSDVVSRAKVARYVESLSSFGAGDELQRASDRTVFGSFRMYRGTTLKPLQTPIPIFDDKCAQSINFGQIFDTDFAFSRPNEVFQALGTRSTSLPAAEVREALYEHCSWVGCPFRFSESSVQSQLHDVPTTQH